MKINFLTILLILTNSFCNSQVSNGVLEYKVLFHENEELSNGMLSSYYKKAVDNAEFVSFILKFDNNKMLFSVDDSALIDDHDTKMTIAFSGVNGDFYKERDSIFTYYEFSSIEFGDIILKTNRNVSWELVNETKVINEFACYKAEGKYFFDNGIKQFEKTVIAWYCPSIPISFGPKGYGGLPGLILELQEDNVHFGVSKIKLNIESVSIKKPTKGLIIDEPMFNEMVKKKLNEFKD